MFPPQSTVTDVTPPDGVPAQPPADNGTPTPGTASPAPATPPAPGTEAPATPPVDAAQLKINQLEQQLAKATQDINRIKSSRDTSLNQVRQQMEAERARLQAERQQLEMSQLDEAGKAQYLLQVKDQQLAEAQQRLAEMQMTVQQQQAFNGALAWYTSNLDLTPAERMALTSAGSYDELAQLGSEMVATRLRGGNKPAASVSQSQANPPATPPSVLTRTPAPSAKPTLDQLAKQYGGYESVYRMVENGQLPGDVLLPG